jgi:hypothetical protein
VTRNTPRSGHLGALALGVLLCGLGSYAIARPEARPTGLLRDFNAFYCAGRALGVRADPYRSEPLGSCERERKPAPLLTGARGLVMPAPLPPYALVPFIALAGLPYAVAAIVWSGGIVLCVAISVVALRRATGAPLLPLVAAFALGDGYASLCLGQIAPFAVAALAVAATFLSRRQDAPAALAAAFAMLEPHIGLPACLALFVWRRGTRIVLIACALAGTLASFAVAGIGTTLEYVRAVVPAHVLSEVVNEKQFSLTYAAHRLGLADAAAVRAGECWYAAMLVTGIILARIVAKRTGNNAALATIPPALTLLGGPFVHIAQMPAALPAAFVLYAGAGEKTRRVVGGAIVVLAIPWIQFSNLGSLFLILAPLIVAILVATLIERRLGVVAAAAVVTLLFVEQLMYAVTTAAPDATPLLLAQYDPRALAEGTWSLYVHAVGTANARAFDVAKIPTVLGLLTLAAAALRVALRPRDRSRTGRRAPAWKEAEGSWRIAHS